MSTESPQASAPPTLGAILSFSLWGFPVRVRMEFLILAALLGAGGQSDHPAEIAAWIGVVFVSVLFHELGHAIVARRYGYRPWIELYGMGGLTHMERGEDMRPTRWTSDLAIAVAGPVFGLALGGSILLASRRLPVLVDHELARTVVRDFLWANIGWSILNLVPMLPYDGGLAVKAVLGRLFPGRGARLAHGVTLVVGALALAASLYYLSLWTAYLAVRSLLGSGRAFRFDRSLDQAWTRWDAFDFLGARNEAVRAATRPYDAMGLARALELLVFTCLATRDAVGAKAAYEAYPRGLTPSALLRAIVALDSEQHEQAAELFRGVPAALSARVLIPILVAWGTTGWEERAMAWLDPGTFAAIPPEVTRALGEALSLRGCTGLSDRVHELAHVSLPRPVPGAA